MEPLLITTGSVMAEQLRAPKSLVFLISRVWVQVPAVTLVSLSDTQNHDALSFGSDQSILIETPSWTHWFFSEPPQLIQRLSLHGVTTNLYKSHTIGPWPPLNTNPNPTNRLFFLFHNYDPPKKRIHLLPFPSSPWPSELILSVWIFIKMYLTKIWYPILAT